MTKTRQVNARSLLVALALAACSGAPFAAGATGCGTAGGEVVLDGGAGMDSGDGGGLADRGEGGGMDASPASDAPAAPESITLCCVAVLDAGDGTGTIVITLCPLDASSTGGFGCYPFSTGYADCSEGEKSCPLGSPCGGGATVSVCPAGG